MKSATRGVVLAFSLILCLAVQGVTRRATALEDSKSIYHDGWLDLNKNGRMDPYENPELDIEQRIDDLIGRMTLEEKTCQMATLYGYKRVLMDPLPTDEWTDKIWKDGIANIDEHMNGVRGLSREYAWPASQHAKYINETQKFFIEKTRLGIPVDFTNEGIRGTCNTGATCFPAQIGVGSAWNEELVSEIGHVTGEEGKILGYSCIYSPILDLARDPRWGRVVECYTEDPFLASRLGVRMVKALQAEGVGSSPKHFCVYSVPKGARDADARTDPHVAPREVETVYLAPFRAAVMEGDALGVMSSYNDYDGIPITGSEDFLIRRLRKEWGFRGYVVSDSDAVKFIYSKHHVASDYKDAVRQSVQAGLNVRTTFTPPDVFINPLRELVEEGKIAMETIDDRVRDVLRKKYLVGLFDHPYVENPELADEIVHCDAHRGIALKAARQSIVLLKNEGGILPLRKDLKLLVAGPNATAIEHCRSRYGPDNAEIISVLEGIRTAVSDHGEVIHVEGCDITDPGWPTTEILPEPPSEEEAARIKEAQDMARTVDAAIVVVGESDKIVGEHKSRTSLDLSGFQLDLVKAIYETGTPTVVVLINGRPLTINWIDKYVPAIVEAWFPGEACGKAVADVLFGDYNPGGKLPITFPKSVGQIPLNFPFKPGSHAGQGRGHRPHKTRVDGVLYPFGHGLSYTEFEYGNLSIVPKKQRVNGNITITADVTNTGDRKGDEVVQLYIRDEVSSVTTYEKELRGFERITIEPGERRTVAFTLTPDHLSLYNRDMERVVEPGTFKLMVGSSSEDIRLEGRFTMLGPQ